jgi:hypothetical protein
LFAGVSDGSAGMLSMLDGSPKTYWAWAKEYHERDIPLEVVESVYEHRTLTDEFVFALNPLQTLERLRTEIAQIGYAV